MRLGTDWTRAAGWYDSASGFFRRPTRNRAELLERAVRSILAQSDSGGIEILVIDNQSTDGTAERTHPFGAGPDSHHSPSD